MGKKSSIKAHVRQDAPTQKIDWASDKQKFCFEYGPVGAGEGVGGPLLASGGFGSAKTYALCLKALWLSSTFPMNRGVIFRKKWTELQRTTMSTFFKICPPQAYDPAEGGRRSDSEKYLRLTNGSEILWMHMDDPDTEGVIRGIEINWFFGDQMEEVDEEIFDLLMGRLGRWDAARVPQSLVDAGWGWRDPSGRPMPPNYALMACNPDTEMHWLYRRFHPESVEFSQERPMVRFADGKKVHFTSSYKSEGYRMVTMASYENKFLPEVNLNQLLQKDEAFRRRYVEGEWGIPEGQIHFIHETSYIEWCPELIDWIRASCNLYRVLDHGDAAPTCCGWMAVTGEGSIIWYREYYQPNKMISEHRRVISELSEGEDYRANFADPSIFHKTMQKHGGRWSVADEYHDCKALPRNTAIYWQPADNNEMGTRNRINEFLAVPVEGQFGNRRRPHPVTKEMGLWPRMFFVKKSNDYPYGCDWMIRQTKAQKREKLGTEDGKPIFDDKRDDTITDHGYDLIRYGVASRPSAPVVSLPEYSEKTFKGKQRMMRRMKRRGRMKAKQYA